MKRVNGRKIIEEQIDIYSAQKVEPINPDVIINPTARVQVPFRFTWASGIIDSLNAEGLLCGDYLDIGTYNGLMAFIAANKYYSTIERVKVDAIEAHKQSFDAANSTAMIAVERGLNVKIHHVKFEDYKTDKEYDMISAFEVLEHTKDPLFCIEKVYDLLRIGGHFLMTVPEQHSIYGLCDKNQLHYWVTSVQSLVFMFSDDRKWRIKQIIEHGGLVHMLVQKRTYME